MSGPVDPRTYPQAIRTSSPGSSVDGFSFGPLRADPQGALFTALADPVTGANVEVELLDAATVDIGLPTLRALITGAIAIVSDPTNGLGAQFAQVERGYLDADDQAATRVAQLTCAALTAWSPTNAGYDRIRSLVFGDNIGDVDLDVGIMATAAQLYLSNSTGALASGMISADTTAASINASTDNWLRTAGAVYAFNGSSFDRIGIASAANLAETLSGARAQLATAPGEWTLTNAPAANTAATATRAAGAAGVRHVLRSINATLTAIAAAGPLTVVVRDGLTGAGAILWQDRLTAAAGTSDRVSLSGLNIVGSPATAMTVEFTAAPGATNFETLSATGFSS